MSAATGVGTGLRPLHRGSVSGAPPAAPVRIVHLGLGAFARSHGAWYTSAVDTEGEWGIAAFTGRSAGAADVLTPQDGLFHVLERSARGDRAHLVTSIVEVIDGQRVDRLCALLARPEVAIVTLTITEPGYRLRPDGAPDLDDAAVADDIDLLRARSRDDAHGERWPVTALGRLVAGLDARRRAGAGPLAVVPCDNIPDNGAHVRLGLIGLAEAVDPALAAWIATEVSCVATSVDRITPRTTPDDVEAVARLTGWDDRSPVVAEPFSDWILAGEFPGGRPAWERAGARFVSDIEPFERRKLWLLNGAHSSLAYTGLLRGHETVAQAIRDDECRELVRRLWAEARAHLDEDLLEIDRYEDALIGRFENDSIEHRLEQIAAEGVAKLRVRAGAVARVRRDAGQASPACAATIGAWVALVCRRRPLVDAREADIAVAVDEPDPQRALLALIDERLAADPDFVRTVRDAANAWASHTQ